jgi:hypothetical protein
MNVDVVDNVRSSGKVDVKRIVTFHDRITRTADLVGIKLPKSRSQNRGNNSDSDSLYDSFSSSSDSESDATSIASRRPKRSTRKRPFVSYPPPPPPPAVRNFVPNWPPGPPAPPPNCKPLSETFPPPGLPPKLPSPKTAGNVSSHGFH